MGYTPIGLFSTTPFTVNKDIVMWLEELEKEYDLSDLVIKREDQPDTFSISIISMSSPAGYLPSLKQETDSVYIGEALREIMTPNQLVFFQGVDYESNAFHPDHFDYERTPNKMNSHIQYMNCWLEKTTGEDNKIVAVQDQRNAIESTNL